MSRRYVPEYLEVDYDTFRNRADPFGLADEMAAQRSLLVEFRDSIDAMSRERVEMFCNGILRMVQSNGRNLLGHALGIAVEDRADHPGLNKLLEALGKGMASDVFALYEEMFGEVTRITPEQARTMSTLIKNVGDLAEKFKKMSEGVSLKVEYNGQVLEALAKFLAMVVLPYCTREQKAIIGEQAMKFLPEFDPALYKESALSE